jgi:hypothetical protein
MEIYLKTYIDFLCCSCTLASLRKCMSKTCFLKTFFHIESVTIDYRLQCSYHYIHIIFFILHISTIFLVTPYYSKRTCKFIFKPWPKVSDASNELIIICFGTQFFPKRITTNVKHHVLLWTSKYQSLQW